jgi:hypothetical protein
MKTTVDLADELLAEIQRIAHEQGRTMKSLMEEGLRDVIASYQQAEAYRLPDASVGGDGLQPGFQDADWEELRDAAYGNRR